MTISDIMAELRDQFGDTYEVLLVPSVLIGGGHRCRATIQNIHIDGANLQFSATHGHSYQLALNESFRMLTKFRDEKEESPNG